MQSLLTPSEVDSVLRYPDGKAQRLARRGRIPHVILPDGSVRFRKSEIEALIGEKLLEIESDREQPEAVHA